MVWHDMTLHKKMKPFDIEVLFKLEMRPYVNGLRNIFFWSDTFCQRQFKDATKIRFVDIFTLSFQK